MTQDKSAWQIKLPQFPKLGSSLKCDVLVIGGGITGLTAAYMLTKAGKKVCLIERDRLASGDTYCTTAHLTYVTDLRLSEIVKSFGKATAALIWQGGAAAIETIETICRREEIRCDFQRVPGYLHASLEKRGDEQKQLKADCKLAQELGFEATMVDSAPIVARTGVRFANVAIFHPLKYLSGVAQAAAAAGCQIFERSEAMEFSEKPRSVTVNGKQVTYDYAVLATHVPLMGKTGLINATIFQTKVYPYSSYAIGAKVPRREFPEASFWDTSEPYYYLRIHREGNSQYAILGGQDHKTGQKTNTEKCYELLTKMLNRLIPTAKVERRWSGQVIETADGLPYMGETAQRQFAATGFSGNGMTFGTLAAMMACDAALGRKNPWQDIFSVDRKNLRAGTWDYLTENVDYPYYMVRDRLKGSEAKSTREIKRGEGKVLRIEGKRLACSRDENGKLNTVSAICTHMGCVVHWNQAEQTWDCPCHGSRFEATGEVIGGPAEKPLETEPLPRTNGKQPITSSSDNGTPKRRSATKAKSAR